ncbi:MAG: sugar phosphate isomerase/epimerase family protein [Chloroflexota bacterium]|jgi:sugar phosphate isomerase/epimerase|nr:sugar phosphate isomerase/epimerase family protein [Chloroflexota bacterium]MDP6508393.1 sugar phosphate isomerase/epimerase family protein [Chloroflexota bacterium]MDP6758332.1 sugar phosphate isomerase/epimerase family protein [Chloroflexota bacterium]
MKIAVQDVLLPGPDPAAKPALAAACGFNFIEYRYPNLENSWREVRAALADSPVMLHSIDELPFRRLAVPDPDHSTRLAAALRAVDIASELGARVLTTIGALGNISAQFPSDRMTATYVESLQVLAGPAAAAGITLTIEPLNRYETHFLNTLAGTVAIAERIAQPNVKIMADFFHLNLEEPDIAASLRAALPHLAHIHLADSNRLLPGRGHLDFAPALKVLVDSNYSGVMTFECCIGERWQGLGYFSGDHAAELPSARAHLEALLPA